MKISERKHVKTTLWYLSVTRNALVVLITSVLAFFLCDEHGIAPFSLTGPVRGGLPKVRIPEFQLPLNSTSEERTSVTDSIVRLGGAPVTIAIVGILQNVAISKAFSCGKVIDATQEILALGLANVFGSFINAMTVNGAFSRSAVNSASGVKTTFGSVHTGLYIRNAIKSSIYVFDWVP